MLRGNGDTPTRSKYVFALSAKLSQLLTSSIVKVNLPQYRLSIATVLTLAGSVANSNSGCAKRHA